MVMSILIAAAVAAFTIFVIRLMVNRQHVLKLQEAGVPMPTYHAIFGHFPAMKQYRQILPRNTTVHVVISQLAKQFQNGIFYLNLWPFSRTIVVVTNPFLASQVEAAFLDKPVSTCTIMDTINGGPSLMSMRGNKWKKWRGIFNPGFAAGYIIGLAPAIADEVVVFCKLLQDLSRKGEMFELEEYTLRLTFDVITRVTLDARLHYQTQGSAFAECLRRQINWTPYSTALNPFRFLSPRPLVQKYNNYHMNRYLDAEIDKRFKELTVHRKDASEKPQARSRSVISLAMDQYLEDEDSGGELSKELFKELVKPQLRMFLYAGNDTTSSTLLYCYYLLFRHPDVMSKLRAEHDEVFGLDFSPERCSKVISSDPTLLNRIPFTLAVIKEVLRMFPPAGSSREGRPDLVLTDEEGRQYPTEGCNIFTLNLAMHHSPRNFVDPEEFIPHRWLVDPQDPLYPEKGSWRAFEWGPRTCIGQTLAQLELKVALVMTARLFDITPAYEQWDELHPRKGIKSVEGNRVYQAELGGGGAHPADGFPVRVALRK
ncbi:cytochrome P450 [Hypoxylon sp. FL1857]|nr:cytochrome P450 [Hypoxylon sp. FL1857]